MSSSLRLRAKDTALIIIDVQQRLASAMPAPRFDVVTRNMLTLIASAAQLGMPVLASEQYPKGLGRTIPVIVESVARLSPSPIFLDKMRFSLAEEPLLQRFLGNGRKQLLIVGMETHICVFQSARDLVARGYDVQVPRDATISRSDENHGIGLDLIARAGCVVTSTEAALFDLLEVAGTEQFKSLSRLVR